ncbi:MAG: hypothetical protein B5M51_09150 [Anaerolinea sp. 4484_236]|nr:MAG: hypothetical protein B5M51_09150 [Anaerolinea sp. 4484_236]
MPYGDGTGPQGQGPMTGRGAGYCAGTNAPGFATTPGRGRGWGAGFGRGFGRGAGFRRGRGGWGQGGAFPAYPTQPYAAAPYTPEQEVNTLKAQASHKEEDAVRAEDVAKVVDAVKGKDPVAWAAQELQAIETLEVLPKILKGYKGQT